MPYPTPRRDTWSARSLVVRVVAGAVARIRRAHVDVRAARKAHANLMAAIDRSHAAPVPTRVARRAERRTRWATWRMAWRSRYGLSASRDLEPLLPVRVQAATPPQPQPHPTARRAREAHADETSYEVATTSSWRDRDWRGKAQNMLESALTPSLRSGRDKRESVEVSGWDAWHDRHYHDAVLTPPPRRGDRLQADLPASGNWEPNPNASEAVQHVVQLPIVASTRRAIIEHLVGSQPQIMGPPAWVDRARAWEVEVEIQSNHQKTIDRFVQDLAIQVFDYGMGVVTWRRTLSEKVKPYRDPITGRDRAPVYDWDIPDMSTMEAFVSVTGRVLKWRQVPELDPRGRPKEFRVGDVHVARIPTQNSSLFFWTPSFLLPVMYAAGVSQDLKEIIEAHTRSIVDMRYYAAVGDKDYKGGRVSKRMLQQVRDIINRTARGGTAVVPWYVELRALQQSGYLKELTETDGLWDLQIRRGIGGSTLDDGEGDSSNRNTADALKSAVIRTAAMLVPEIQLAFRSGIVHKCFEWGMKIGDIKSWNDVPYLDFPAIDLDQETKRRSQVVLEWTAGLMSHGEAMEELGRDPVPELKDKFFFDIEEEKQIAMDAAKNAARQIGAPSTGSGNRPRPTRRRD